MSRHDILDLFSNFVRAQGAHFLVQDIRLGLIYSAAVVVPPVHENDTNMSQTPSCGLAATLFHETGSCCSLKGFEQPDLLIGQTLGSVLASADLSDGIQRSLVLALGNAVLNQLLWSAAGRPHDRKKNHKLQRIIGLESLDLQDRKVAMVGFFKPIASALQGKAAQIAVLEKQSSRHQEIVRYAQLLNTVQDLERFEVVIVTATSIINYSFHTLLDHCRNASVIVMGPSTPLLPALFEHDYPQVKKLSGRIVTNIPKTLAVVSLGGGTGQLKKYTQKVELTV